MLQSVFWAQKSQDETIGGFGSFWQELCQLVHPWFGSFGNKFLLDLESLLFEQVSVDLVSFQKIQVAALLDDLSVLKHDNVVAIHDC